MKKFVGLKKPPKAANDYNYSWDKEGQDLLSKIKDKTIKNSESIKIIEKLFLSEELPQNLRLTFWYVCCGLDESMKEKKNEKYYKDLVRAFNIMVKREHPFYIYMRRKISLDIDRSFSNETIKTTKENVIQLKNILEAFTVRNVSINYCQGLNGIVAYFLETTNFKEQESFYLYKKILEDILPYDYYLLGIGVQAEIIVLGKILEKFLPDLIEHLRNIEGDLLINNVFTNAITSLLIYKTDRNITNFLMDCFFLFSRLMEDKDDEVYFIMYKIILAIFKSIKDELMKCKNMSSVNGLLKFNIINQELMKKIIYNTFIDNEITKNINYIKKLRNEEVDKILSGKKMYFNFQNENNIACNVNYPLCVEEKDYSIPVDLYIIYRRANLFTDIKDIDFEENKKELSDNEINDEKNENDDNDDDKILENIIIERRKHYCK